MLNDIAVFLPSTGLPPLIDYAAAVARGHLFAGSISCGRLTMVLESWVP